MANFVPFKKTEKFQFYSYIQLPREFTKREEYKSLSPNAMVVYSVLADRLKMSFAQIDKKSKINFYDANGDMYVIFKRNEIEKEVHLSRTALDTAIKQLKDCNLIVEVQQYNNQPNRIYVGKTLDMIEYSEQIKIRDAQNVQSGMYKTNTPECTNHTPPYNNKNINNNKYNNKPSNANNYQGRIYPPGFLDQLYANKDAVEDTNSNYEQQNDIAI